MLAIIVCGVCGCGKSAVSRQLASLLKGRYIDADDVHSVECKEKMARGTSLDDDDRRDWLSRCAKLIDEHAEQKRTVVLACSALKRKYRDQLQAEVNSALLFFVELEVSRNKLEERLRARSNHFMPPSLLDSQLATLESIDLEEEAPSIRVSNERSDCGAWASVEAWCAVEAERRKETSGTLTKEDNLGTLLSLDACKKAVRLLATGAGKNLTDFQCSVLAACLAIPQGTVSSYGDLAKMVGSPGAARAVGQTLRNNPFAPLVPCHRIVSSTNGALNGFNGSREQSSLLKKRSLLEREGVEVDEKLNVKKK